MQSSGKQKRTNIHSEYKLIYLHGKAKLLWSDISYNPIIDTIRKQEGSAEGAQHHLSSCFLGWVGSIILSLAKKKYTAREV